MREIITCFLLSLVSITTYAQTPSFSWAKNAGGLSNDIAESVTSDLNGNVYVTGTYYSNSSTFGSITLTNANGGFEEIFIAKYNVSGNIIWAKSIGGQYEDRAYSITTDVFGNVFIAGRFYSPTLTFDTITLTNTGASDIFIAKYDANGNALWAKSAIGTSYEIANSISTDPYGNVYITGKFFSNIITFDTTILTNAGNEDIFIARYDNNGNLKWADNIGGNENDVSYAISADLWGNAIITGNFKSPYLTFGTTTLLRSGTEEEIFVIKYDSSGNVNWAKCANGNAYDVGKSISTDKFGNVFISGTFNSQPLNFGNKRLINKNNSDFFVAKYDANGNELWAKGTGGGLFEFSSGLACDKNGNVIVTGGFTSPSLLFGNTLLTNSGYTDIFIAKYDQNGNSIWAKSVMGLNEDQVNGINVDTFGNVLIAGTFRSSTLIFELDTLINSGGFNSPTDIFLAKIENTFSIGFSVIKHHNIKIYPNPTTNIISIERLSQVEKSEVALYDIQGKLMLMKEILENVTIDLSDFTQGVYMIRIGDVVHRIVKI